MTPFIPKDGDIERYNIPLVERVADLYARGYRDTDIHQICQLELSDILINPLGILDVANLIKNNKEFFDQRRQQMSALCQQEVAENHAILFKAVGKAEIKMVDTYAEKLHEVLNELRGLDISETDEDGNKINTSRVFVLLELADKLQSKASKVSGTEVMREIEAFKMKAAIKAETESIANNPLPSYAPGSEMKNATPTKFHDV